MVYNPATVPNETIISEAEQLRRALVIFFETDAGGAFWKTKVVPIIQRMVKSGIATSAEGAVALTVDFIMERGALIWVRNKTSKMIVLESTEFVGAATKGLAAATNILGWIAILSMPAGAETERKWEYNTYLARYLTYLMKSAALGGNHMNNMPPPLSYPQYINTSMVGSEWWLRE
jgi:hypothetical protein